VELAEMTYIIRDHDHNIFNDRKKNLREIVNQLNDKYGQPLIEIEFKDQYINMADVIKNNMELVERPLNILKEMGVNVCSLPIRGGTDGASLSFMGIPCPNLCTGGYNYHSRYEYASIQEMEKTAQLLIELAK
jgi:tripeptide aminopeptidase